MWGASEQTSLRRRITVYVVSLTIPSTTCYMTAQGTCKHALQLEDTADGVMSPPYTISTISTAHINFLSFCRYPGPPSFLCNRWQFPSTWDEHEEWHGSNTEEGVTPSLFKWLSPALAPYGHTLPLMPHVPMTFPLGGCHIATRIVYLIGKRYLLLPTNTAMCHDWSCTMCCPGINIFKKKKRRSNWLHCRCVT